MKIRNLIRICLFLCSLFVFGNLSAEPEIGQEVISPQNRYLLVDQLGEGAFGRVFSAEDSNGDLVAIKWYTNYNTSITDFYPYTTDDFWNRLGDIQREYENGQWLNHPNIIRSLELFSHSEQEHYLVLEYVPGTTVYNLQRKEISLVEASKIASQLVDALSYAESEGLLHMDLHMNNWMIDQNKDSKVIDLASFFSWEELEKLMTDETSYSGILRQFPQHNAPLAPRAQKLQKFLMEHPELQRKTFYPRKASIEAQAVSRNLVLAVYFDIIIESSQEILRKSKGNRLNRIEKIRAIENLLINVYEETEETRDLLRAFDFRKKMKELHDLLLM